MTPQDKIKELQEKYQKRIDDYIQCNGKHTYSEFISDLQSLLTESEKAEGCFYCGEQDCDCDKHEATEREINDEKIIESEKAETLKEKCDICGAKDIYWICGECLKKEKAEAKTQETEAQIMIRGGTREEIEFARKRYLENNITPADKHTRESEVEIHRGKVGGGFYCGNCSCGTGVTSNYSFCSGCGKRVKRVE